MNSYLNLFYPLSREEKIVNKSISTKFNWKKVNFLSILLEI